MERTNKNHSLNIQWVRRSGIDVLKWDRVIESASNARVYSAAWYLDIVAGTWDALIMGDYEFIMPVPAKCKFGIRYAYTPYYTQQLGIFPPADTEVQAAFAQKLTGLYRHIIYSVDHSVIEEAFAGYRFTVRRNRLLNLGDDYQQIRMGYKVKTRNTIVRTEKLGLTVAGYREPESAEIFMKAYKPDYSGSEALRVLDRLIRYALETGQGIIYMVCSPDSELLGGAFILFHKNRAYYLISFASPRGKLLGAPYAILNEFFRKNCSSGLLFDFEGSDIPGIDAFFRGFGTSIENYYRLEYNRLPSFILKMKELLTRR
jgi:hypothetical protein